MPRSTGSTGAEALTIVQRCVIGGYRCQVAEQHLLGVRAVRVDVDAALGHAERNVVGTVS